MILLTIAIVTALYFYVQYYISNYVKLIQLNVTDMSQYRQIILLNNSGGLAGSEMVKQIAKSANIPIENIIPISDLIYKQPGWVRRDNEEFKGHVVARVPSQDYLLVGGARKINDPRLSEMDPYLKKIGNYKTTMTIYLDTPWHVGFLDKIFRSIRRKLGVEEGPSESLWNITQMLKQDVMRNDRIVRNETFQWMKGLSGATKML